MWFYDFAETMLFCSFDGKRDFEILVEELKKMFLKFVYDQIRLNPSFFVDKYGYAHLNSYPNGHVHNWTIMTISITWFVHSYCFFYQTYISCIYLVMIPAVEVD